MEDHGIFLVTVVGAVAVDDNANGGHLGCVFFLAAGGPPPRLLVTSAKWLREA